MRHLPLVAEIASPVRPGVLERLEQMILRTPLAEPARWIYRGLYPLTPEEKNSRYDAETRAVMERVLKADSNCVDVGAHAGAILRAMIEFAPAGRHLAFEPLPEFAEQLRQSYPQVHIFEVALSDRAGEVSFHHVVENPAYSGIQRRQYPSESEEVKLITVRTERLDALVPDDLPIALMKVDVEGAEMQVFRGAADLISRCRPFIIFEHGLGAADHYGTQPGELYDLLTSRCGLRVTLMRHWLRGQRAFTRAGFIRHYEARRDFYYLAYP